MTTGNKEQKVILVLAASPENLGDPKENPEINIIRHALQTADRHQDYRIEISAGVTVSKIIQELVTYKPFIIHYIGHSGAKGLYIEQGNNHQVKLLTNDELDTIFKSLSGSAQCVILNSCNSDTQAQVIHRYVTTVIGSNEVVFGDSARKYAGGFYSALFNFPAEKIVQAATFLSSHNLGCVGSEQTEAYSFHGLWSNYSALKGLISQSNSSSKDLRTLCLESIESHQYHLIPQGLGKGKLLDALIDIHTHNTPPPLLFFLKNLINKEINETLKEQLQTWLNLACENKNIPLKSLSYQTENKSICQPTSHALIEIYPIQKGSHFCNADVWLHPSSDFGCILSRDKDHPLDINNSESVTEFIDELIETLPDDQQSIQLEFFLPLDLINLGVGNWEDEDEDKIISRYCTVIRSWERIRGKKKYRAFWSTIDYQDTRKLQECFDFVTSNDFDSKDIQACSNIALTFSPLDRKSFIRILKDGLPVLLWSRVKQKEADITSHYEQHLHSVNFQTLPSKLQQLQNGAIRNKDTNSINNHLSLLWDDKERLPENCKLFSPAKN